MKQAGKNNKDIKMKNKISKIMIGILLTNVVGISNVEADVKFSMRDGVTIVSSSPWLNITQGSGIGTIFNSKSKLLTYYDDNRHLMVQHPMDHHCHDVLKNLNIAKQVTEKMMKKNGLSQTEIDLILSSELDQNTKIIELGSGGQVAGFNTKLVKVMVGGKIVELLWLSNDAQLVKETKKLMAQFIHMDLDCGIDGDDYENSTTYTKLMLNHAMLKSYQGEVAASLEDEEIDYIINVQLGHEEDLADLIEEIVAVSFEQQSVKIKHGLKPVSIREFMRFSIQ